MNFKVNLEKLSLSELETLYDNYGIIINSFNAMLNINEIYIRYNFSKEEIDYVIESEDQLLKLITEAEKYQDIIKNRINYILETS